MENPPDLQINIIKNDRCSLAHVVYRNCVFLGVGTEKSTWRGFGLKIGSLNTNPVIWTLDQGTSRTRPRKQGSTLELPILGSWRGATDSWIGYFWRILNVGTNFEEIFRLHQSKTLQFCLFMLVSKYLVMVQTILDAMTSNPNLLNIRHTIYTHPAASI